MAWTYNPLILSDTDHVRLLIGDTKSTDPQLQDEEIDFLLTEHGAVRSAAIAACRTLAAKYARLCDKWVGDLKILASQKQLHYTRLMEMLSASNLSAVPSAGGISIAQKTAYEGDTDRVQPAFRRGMDDNV